MQNKYQKQTVDGVPRQQTEIRSNQCFITHSTAPSHEAQVIILLYNYIPTIEQEDYDVAIFQQTPTRKQFCITLPTYRQVTPEPRSMPSQRPA